MKRNWLLVPAMVLAVAAAANASSLDVQFSAEQANPGDTVQLVISGVADSASDAMTVVMDLTATGSAPVPPHRPQPPHGRPQHSMGLQHNRPGHVLSKRVEPEGRQPRDTDG